jgi:1,4-alpha-glucan branching enzyme
VVDDAEQSVLAFVRHGNADDRPVAVVANFTPVPRHRYRIGLPWPGRWREILNSDASLYGGSGFGNFGAVTAGHAPSHGFPASAELTLPPLATIYLAPDPE